MRTTPNSLQNPPVNPLINISSFRTQLPHSHLICPAPPERQGKPIQLPYVPSAGACLSAQTQRLDSCHPVYNAEPPGAIPLPIRTSGEDTQGSLRPVRLQSRRTVGSGGRQALDESVDYTSELGLKKPEMAHQIRPQRASARFHAVRHSSTQLE